MEKTSLAEGKFLLREHLQNIWYNYFPSVNNLARGRGRSYVGKQSLQTQIFELLSVVYDVFCHTSLFYFI